MAKVKRFLFLNIKAKRIIADLEVTDRISQRSG
jgi:hypothetical protein